MRVFVTGATGYVGFHVATALRRAGNRVWGLTRSAEKAHRLAQHEIEPIVGDLADPKSYADVAARCAVLVHAAFEYSAQGVTKDKAAVDALLDHGAVGLCLPAAALSGPDRVERLGPVLERLAARRAPMFVHPGPAPAESSRLPAWWAPMTAYVSEMQAAWLAWAEWGRPAHPDLKVVWAMLAGAAPLQAERLAARRGPAAAVHDPHAWFDVSSYGPHAVDAMLRVVGVDRLVLGSDRPVADPPALASLGPAVLHAVSKANPARLFA